MLLFVVISFACWFVIVVILPAFAVVEVVPITKSEVPSPVPAPIRVLISVALIPVFKLGEEPSEIIADLPST